MCILLMKLESCRYATFLWELQPVSIKVQSPIINKERSFISLCLCRVNIFFWTTIVKTSLRGVVCVVVLVMLHQNFICGPVRPQWNRYELPQIPYFTQIVTKLLVFCKKTKIKLKEWNVCGNPMGKLSGRMAHWAAKNGHIPFGKETEIFGRCALNLLLYLLFNSFVVYNNCWLFWSKSWYFSPKRW